MPAGMVVGALLCRQVAWVDGVMRGWLTPAFIFLMLFFTFCRVDARKIRFSWMHLWLLLFQMVGSVAVYYALEWCDVVVDGRYEEAERDLTLHFRGSRNQRIIDVQKSLAAGEVVLVENV